MIKKRPMSFDGDQETYVGFPVLSDDCMSVIPFIHKLGEHCNG